MKRDSLFYGAAQVVFRASQLELANLLTQALAIAFQLGWNLQSWCS